MRLGGSPFSLDFFPLLLLLVVVPVDSFTTTTTTTTFMATYNIPSYYDRILRQDDRDLFKPLAVPEDIEHVRVFAISDLHSDYKKSLEWWNDWADKIANERPVNTFDVIIIPGE